jgi:hypothetical protein
MSQVLSMRLREEQMDRLRRTARQSGRTPSETAAVLVEEGMRRNDFAFIDFRDSPAGRQAYIQGTSLAVWEVVMVAQSCGMSAERTAELIRWPLARTRAALNYATAFPDEINLAIQDNDAMSFEALSRMLPQAEEFVVEPASGAAR